MAFADSKPDWKQRVLTTIPLFVATGLVTTIGLHANLADRQQLLEVLASLGSNLLASGIAACCSLRRPVKEYEQALANHDLQQLIRDAWGEAAIASLKEYEEKHRAQNTSFLPVTRVLPTPAFLKLIRELKREDFVTDGDITASNLRSALEASRRAILPLAEERSAATEPQLLDVREIQSRANEAAEHLKDAMIDSVVSLIEKKTPGQPIPDDLRQFLNGGDEALKQGILGQLCIYVAFYLKARPNAQTAVLHVTLQEISDRQVGLALLGNRIETLCIQIRKSQSAVQQNLLDSFSEQLAASLHREFSQLLRPRLEVPFASSPTWNARFSYRAKWKGFVGRKDSMKALLEFMRDPRPSLWTVISGPAGSGKNRLAAELVSKFRDPSLHSDDNSGIPDGPWHAGFLASGSWLESDVDKWYPDTDTLIVVDYASSLDSARLLSLLKWVSRCKEDGHHRVRVILLDRLPPDSQFGISSRYGASDYKADIDPVRWYSISQRRESSEDSAKVAGSTGEAFRGPLDLDPVGELDALEIVRNWAGTKWSTGACERIRQAIRSDGELARPLFASLLGDAIANDALPGELNPVTVSSVALKRLFHGQDPECREQKERVAMLLAAATACQGVAEEKLFRDDDVLCGLTGDPSLSEQAVIQLADCLKRFSGFSGQIPPVEPDFVGGLLVLEQLLAQPRFPRSLAKAKHLATFAWEFGHAPDEFLARLASDFVGRVQQLAGITRRSPEFVEELLIQLLLSGLCPNAIKRDGPSAIAWAVYVSSKSGQSRTAEELIAALEGSWSISPEEIDPEILAQAWFGLGLSSDLPPSAQAVSERAMNELSGLLRRYNRPDIALWLAKALVNATVPETDAKRREALADRIGEIRKQHDTPEIALQQAQALYNATVGEMDAKWCEALADRIGEIRKQYDTPEIALPQAQALVNATVGETDARRREGLADRIGEIRKQHDTPEIALRQARALVNATAAETDAKRCEALAERIGELRKQHDTSEIALQQAKALVNATVRETDAKRREALADRIGELRKQHDTPEIALAQAQALVNATVRETDAKRREALADRIGEIGKQHDTPEIALRQARALANATVGETDAKRCEALADRIGELRKQHDTPEIALRQAQALANATAAETDAKRCEALADRIGELRKQHDTPEIALQQAQALYNATVGETDAKRREALADRIRKLIDVLSIPEADRMQANTLIEASVAEMVPERREALASSFANLLAEALHK